MSNIETEIEERLAQAAPDGRGVVLVEVVGLTHCACSSTTPTVSRWPCASRSPACSATTGTATRSRCPPRALSGPLTKPSHYSRFLGRRAKLRLREARDGHKSVTGELVGASEEEVTIAAPSGVVAIPYSQIVRSNLVPGD